MRIEVIKTGLCTIECKLEIAALFFFFDCKVKINKICVLFVLLLRSLVCLIHTLYPALLLCAFF